MAKGKMLIAIEKAQIVKLLGQKKSTLKLHRDHRTVKRFVNEGKEGRKEHKKGDQK